VCRVVVCEAFARMEGVVERRRRRKKNTRFRIYTPPSFQTLCPSLASTAISERIDFATIYGGRRRAYMCQSRTTLKVIQVHKT
jgi:hypothetical protein